MLLKVLSNEIDAIIKTGKILPRNILDAGSGVGVLGVCAAGALLDTGSDFHIRSQDRDELASIFTGINARINKIPDDKISSFTEPMLAGPFINYDLILTNIPAKAGLPVLEDFITRSVNMINADGRIMMVAVNTLSQFFTEQINNYGALFFREQGPGHTVYVFGQDIDKSDRYSSDSVHAPINNDNFFIKCPGYIRNKNDYEMENITYHLDTIHGAQGFDSPGNDAEAAAKLTLRLGEKIAASEKPLSVLIWAEDQGHYAAWFVKWQIQLYFSFNENEFNFVKNDFNMVLAGRNILALSTARRNTVIALGEDSGTEKIKAVSAADLLLDMDRIKNEKNGFNLLAIFPEPVPGTDRYEAMWESLARLALPSAIVITCFTSSEAGRFDRRKTPAFQRLGDYKKNGYRAMAYMKIIQPGLENFD